MKIVWINLLLLGMLHAGFFNEESAKAKQDMLENERLCKLFTKKAQEYKKHMRDDLLAKTTLASYEHRASLFCKKAKQAESNLTK